MRVLLRIATRNLLRNRRRTLFVVLSIAVGVTAVTGVRGFLNGLQGSLISGFVEGATGAIQVHAKGFAQNLDAAPLRLAFPVDDVLLARVEAIDGVRAVAPRLGAPVLLARGDASTFALSLGVDPVREPRALARRVESVSTGAFIASDDDVLVGRELLGGLKGALDDEVTLVGNDTDGVMNGVAGHVKGELAAFTQGEKKLVLLSLARAQELFRAEGRATELAIAVDDLDDLDATAARVRLALGDAYEVHTWREIATFAADVVETQNAALDAVVFIFLVVILFGLANALLTSVYERVREIGTMLAVGATKRQVLTLFVIESSALGLVGGFVGALVGTLIVTALGQNGVTLTTPGASLPQHLFPFITADFLVRIVVIATLGAALTALWPAWKASRMSPVDALSST